MHFALFFSSTFVFHVEATWEFSFTVPRRRSPCNEWWREINEGKIIDKALENLEFQNQTWLLGKTLFQLPGETNHAFCCCSQSGSSFQRSLTSLVCIRSYFGRIVATQRFEKPVGRRLLSNEVPTGLCSCWHDFTDCVQRIKWMEILKNWSYWPSLCNFSLLFKNLCILIRWDMSALQKKIFFTYPGSLSGRHTLATQIMCVSIKFRHVRARTKSSLRSYSINHAQSIKTHWNESSIQIHKRPLRWIPNSFMFSLFTFTWQGGVENSWDFFYNRRSKIELYWPERFAFDVHSDREE